MNARADGEKKREGRVWRESRRRWRQLQWAAEEAVSVGWESRAIFLTVSKGVSALVVLGISCRFFIISYEGTL